MPSRRKPAGNSVSHVELERFRRDLAECIRKIERLEDALEINIRRMGAMQAELDHLRGRRAS